MGLTSYYPINRSVVGSMPSIVKPDIVSEYYKQYEITKEMNIVPCFMSQLQFEKYTEVWTQEKTLDAYRRMRGGNIYNDDDPYHYHTRTRQTCNVIFEQDDFRIIKKTEANKQELESQKMTIYQKLVEDKILKYENRLQELSPKMFEIMKHIQKFIKNDIPTGKILFYSDFRSDGGSEAFELVLKCNGYTKFNYLNPEDSKEKRYTFITGNESPEERKINKEYFNDEKNKYGEYTQIMIISSAGAEGISLTCVRQVHILEPYWNYVRIDQVLGRAIRMRSHDTLPEKDRNVEQYIYLSILPEGNTIEEIYECIQQLPSWNIPEWSDIKDELSKTQNKDYKELFDNITKINTDSDNLSTDQYLFNVMDKKYKISNEIQSIIKESSLDCIQHTQNDPLVNERCIRYSEQLQNEIAYFPGLGSLSLENIDLIQLKAKFMYHIKPDIYVISGKTKEDQSVYIYYQYKQAAKKEIDIRYIRENGIRLADVHVISQLCYIYVKDHEYESKIDKKLKIYQEIYMLSQDILDTYISQSKFPTLEMIQNKQEFVGYKIKDMIYNQFYFLKISDKESDLQRLYIFEEFIDSNYMTDTLKPLVMYKGELYIGS